MGYSLSVQARNPKLLARMVDFMGANFRPWWQVIGSEHQAAYMGFRDDVSYGKRKNTLGFDYNASGLERIYTYATTRWLALKVGKSRSKFKDDYSKDTWESPTPIPYYFYDVDTHPTPILVTPTEEMVRTLPNKVVFYACDEMGVPWSCSETWQYEGMDLLYTDEKLYFLYSAKLKEIGFDKLNDPSGKALRKKRNQIILEVAGEKIAQVRGVMHDELKRLDSLWKGTK